MKNLSILSLNLEVNSSFLDLTSFIKKSISFDAFNQIFIPLIISKMDSCIVEKFSDLKYQLNEDLKDLELIGSSIGGCYFKGSNCFLLGDSLDSLKRNSGYVWIHIHPQIGLTKLYDKIILFGKKNNLTISNNPKYQFYTVIGTNHDTKSFTDIELIHSLPKENSLPISERVTFTGSGVTIR